MPAHISSTTPPLRWSSRTTARPISTSDGRSGSRPVTSNSVAVYKPSGGDGARRRQHAVAADQLAGVVLADQQVIAELVEAVGVSAVGPAPSSANPGSEVNTS